MGFWFGPRYPVVHSDSEDTLGKTRRRPRALAHHLGISLLTCAVLFVAFALFFLVGISLPIIKSIYIFHIDFATDASQPVTSVATDLRFGVWGLCAYSDLGQSECFGPMLGYTIPDEILTLTGYPQLVEALEEGLLVILVLHLVAGALAFLGVFTSLFLESHGMAIASLVTSVFTVLVGAVVFAIDLTLILVGKQRISGLTDFNYQVDFGPGVWMVLIAVALSFLGMVLMSVVVCECCGVGRHHHHRHRSGEKC